MRRLYGFIILSMALLPLTGTARTIADLFADEPGKIFQLLTRTNRLDMVDYYNNGQKVDQQNNLAGTSKLSELDSAYLKVQTSASKTVEMRLLTPGRDTVIIVIETVLTPVPDSRLTVWNQQWQQLKTEKHFKMPKIDDFIDKNMPRELRADLHDAMVFPLIQLAFQGEKHDEIVATHGLEQFLVPDEYKRFASHLKPSLTYRINGNKIKPVKK